ncbi:dnaJ-like protein subfamily C member 21 [Pyrus ussuriensis x Pyrus communis]|uniref:DnaJ-like protein subfamily C member 21 n=1 Tax=Pyrus ussuriensis x Pyrus communis TaxID=2448454 RepID=A0A5N5G7S4_9ROSA|nr:dnaJ-like protein subfamily C member 21 [Pyrus ussuriensis x Pyrus communis]
MAASERRCHYEVLGLPRDCSADEIRSAYRKLALQRHPDKLVQSGLSQSEATAQFQELAHAYEVLSDPKERAWYDSHRSQILFSDRGSAASGSGSGIPNLFPFFSTTVFSGYSDSGRGFYKVYSDVFDKIYANELNFARKLGLGLDTVREAPAMGNLESPYVQVTAFYNYWAGFCTVMDFCWEDMYDVLAGPNRKSRRLMEEENKKVRKKAKREFNETVRGLADFVKKRDKRVMDMMLKKEEERVRKSEEERERKKKLEKEKLERAMAYEEPEWAKVEEEELCCVVCGKKFKSEKQWKNHEQSKKHRDKVAEYRESIGEEDLELDDEEVLEGEGEERGELDDVDELGQEIREGLKIGEEEDGAGVSDQEDELHEFGAENGSEKVDEALELDGDEDELGVLEAMVTGRKSKKNAAFWVEREDILVTDIRAEKDDDDTGFMEYNNRKSAGRKGGARKERGKKSGGEANNVDKSGNNGGQSDESNEQDNSNMKESTSHSVVENESNDQGDEQIARKKKSSSKAVDKKEKAKKEANDKLKNSSNGKKSKLGALKNTSNACDTCGEEFESRNKLHMHLGDTGHAKLKYR